MQWNTILMALPAQVWRGMLLAFLLPAFHPTVATTAPAWSASDAAGYVGTNQTSFNWQEIGSNFAGGTNLNLPDDGAVTFPFFPFTYYGRNYSSLTVNSNGLLSFSSQFPGPSKYFVNTHIPSNDPPNGLVCPFWDDLVPEQPLNPNNVWGKIRGLAPNRVLILEWQNISFYSVQERVTFQVLLYEGTNEIKFQYKTIPSSQRSTGGGATTGIEDPFGLDGIQYCLNEPGRVDTNLALLFSPPGHPTPIPTQPPPLNTATPTPTTNPTSLPTPGLAGVTLSPIDATGFPTVNLVVRVTDLMNGLPVYGLTQNDFTISEKPFGSPNPFTPQVITSFQNFGAERGVSIALVLDRSGSMGGAPLEDVKKGAINFINDTSCQDRIGIVIFNDFVQTLAPFTSDRNELEEQIKTITDGGGTSIFDAVVHAVYDTQTETGVKAIILFTDGQDGGGNFTKAQAISAAAAEGIPVFTIGLNITAGSQAEQDLIDLANGTGGTYTAAANATQLQQIYSQIEQQLSDQYLLTYDSSDPALNTRRSTRVTALGNFGDNLFWSRLSCLIDHSSANGTEAAEVSRLQSAAQQFINPRTNALFLWGIDLYFDYGGNSVVAVELLENEPTSGIPGGLKTSADGLTRLISCPGWQRFTFQDTSESYLRLDPNTPYWMAVHHLTSSPAYLRNGGSGTSPGGLSLGQRQGTGPITWSPGSPSQEALFKVYACLDAPSPTPTRTPTPIPSATPLPDTPTPTTTPTPPFPTLILAGGYLSGASSGVGGDVFSMKVLVRGEHFPAALLLTYGGIPSGFGLGDEGGTAEHWYGTSFFIPSGAPAGRYLLEMRVDRGTGGGFSVWPKLQSNRQKAHAKAPKDWTLCLCALV